MQENPPVWCTENGCDLKLYQDGKTLHAASNNGRMTCRMHALVYSFCINIPNINAVAVGIATLEDAFLGEPLQGKVRELQMALA